jgi:hypothetical protein
VGVGCMQKLQLQHEGENPKMFSALFSKLVAVTCKEFGVIQSTYSVHRANNFAITMIERMMFLLQFCSSDTKACAVVIGFACATCFQCKSDTSLFIDDCCRDSSANLPWESLRGQLLVRPCAAFSIVFEKLANVPNIAQKSERTRANIFLSITHEALKNQKVKYADSVQENRFVAARECRHVLRLVCKKKAFIMKQDPSGLHSGCTNCCLEILQFFDLNDLPVVIYSDAMTALQLFIEPLILSLPSDIAIQDHDVVTKILEVVSKFRGNGEGQIGDGRFGIEFRTTVSCFVVSILKDFCAEDRCFSEGLSVVTQLLEFVHIIIRNLFSEANRLGSLNSEQTYTLVSIPQLETALSELCSVTASLCVQPDDAINVIANKIFVSRAIIVTFFKCAFDSGMRLPCSMIKCCVSTFHQLISGHCLVLDMVDKAEKKIQSLKDEMQCIASDILVFQHGQDPNAFSDSNEDDNMAMISDLMERSNLAEKDAKKEQISKDILADSLRSACSQLPDSLIWQLHGLIMNRYSDSAQDKRDARFKISEELSQMCLRCFTLEWRVRAEMDSIFTTCQSPWQTWFKFFGPESTSITIVGGMRLKEGQYTNAVQAQRLIPLQAALFVADAAPGVVAAHPEQFLRVWLLFALDVKCPKHDKHALFYSLHRILFSHIALPSLLSAPSHDLSDDCAIVCRQMLYLSKALPSLSKASSASFCEFFENALHFGLGCLLLVPQYIREQQSDLPRYFCCVAALLCKLFWREMTATPSNHSKQTCVLNIVISELFILPPKFLHDSCVMRQTVEDLVACCISWAAVDCAAAMDTLYRIVRAQMQFLVAASGLPSRPQSAVDHIVHALCGAALADPASHIFVMQTIQCIARFASLQMTRDIRCLCFHVISACLCKLLHVSSKQDCGGLFDHENLEVAAAACCQTFIELMQELGSSVDSSFAEALAEFRTCISHLCLAYYPAAQPPTWLVLMVRFMSCTLLHELINATTLAQRESNADCDPKAAVLLRRVEACQSTCLLSISRDLRVSISKPKMLPVSHHTGNFLLFLTMLCERAPHAFSCDMQLAACYIASHCGHSADHTNAWMYSHLLSDECSRSRFASATLM